MNLKKAELTEYPKHITDFVKSHLLQEKVDGKSIFCTVVHAINVWKKVYEAKKYTVVGTSFWEPAVGEYGDHLGRVIELTLPEGTVIHISHWSKKCRANQAIVGDLRARKRLISGEDYDFVYRPNTMVFPTQDFSFLPDECQSGIHFFFDKNDAKNW
jgi:hypothetical protein